MNDPPVAPAATSEPTALAEPATSAESLVRCPECAAHYRLPEAWMGTRGARVRCRLCGVRFEVEREADAETLAAQIVEGLADRIPALLIAQARGRLFAEAGTFVFEAFDAWRRRAGPEADPAVFREALRRRWDIDVP